MIFLACIGTNSYEIFETMAFANNNEKEKISKVIEAFENTIFGEVNVTYEQYIFD